MKDNKKSIKKYADEAGVKVLKRFTRFKVGQA